MVRERIRTAIENSNWSQHTFSAKIGIATPNFNAFLKGTRPLPYPKFIKTLDELALTIGPKSSGASIIPPSEMPEIFRQQIELSGYKIMEVAQKAEIDLACLSTFLNGSRTTPIRNIEKLMRVLNLDLVKLIRPKAPAAS
jgi:ribosome-binding protein aMBF1 (putative translation factor)